jgi:serine/threonine-protein kinase
MSEQLRAQLQSTLGDAYTLERELGGGGMSRVFVAEETRLKRKVVVKVLTPELAAGVSADRFEREIGVAAQLQHPNIVPVLTAGDSAGVPYYTMPFVEGLSLRARIAREGALPIGQSVSILRDVARALAYAHEHGVVHRDIKPDNVLLTGDAAVVTDFGIAKALSASRTNAPEGSLTQTGTSLGTPTYMSPEQVTGEAAVDHRADLYAFGVTAYELLTGKPPFEATSAHRIMAAHVQEAPPPLSARRGDTPRVLAALVMQCLEKDPARRPQSARELLQALDALTTPTGASARDVGARSPRSLRAALAAGAGVALLAALGWGVTAWRARGAGAAGAGDTVRSIAVLPFENAAGDTANAYFAEGIAEELITALSKVPGLRVAGRSSSFRFSGKGSDTREVARTLNVASLLEGSVRRSGSRMRVTAQLTNAADGVVLWSESYEREIKDAFAVQDEITRAIVGALQVRLASGAPAAAATAPAREVNPEAYDAYLRGLAYFRQRGKYILPAIGFFEQAIARDSTFARAYAQLATALAMLPNYSPVSFDSLRTRTFAVAERAIALDPSSGEARAALATAYAFSTAEYKTSIAEFERALALDPNYSASHYLLSTALFASGQYDRGVAEARRAVELDPVSPVARFVLSRGEMQARLYEDAAANARRAMQLDSLFPLAPPALAAAEYFLGHRDVARQIALRNFAAPAPAPASGPYLAFVLSATGDAATRAELMRTLEAKRPSDSQRETSLAAGWLGAGDSSRAFGALERAAARKEPINSSMGFGSPVFDPIRSSARFTAILRMYGLDPALVNAAAARRAR